MSDPAQNPWLPPSPHREKVLEILANGRAHLESQGHGKPPLLISEDGGAMELPQFRWAAGHAAADASQDPASPTTRFLDVCGSIDELKWELRQHLTDRPGDPAVMERLLDDALAMIRRMFGRLDEYRAFTAAVRAKLEEMDSLAPPEELDAQENAAALRTAFREQPEHAADELERRYKQAEAVRTVAGDLEKVLYRLRDVSIEIGALYEQVRGAREWKR